MIEFEIQNLFPKFLLADKNGYAMSKALEAGMRECDRVIQDGIDRILTPEKMPEWRCDEMAWEYNLGWYDYDGTLENKRRQIAQAMEIYNILGTPEAVQRAISAVYSNGTVSEWFEYDGDPYHFSVYTTDVSATGEKRANFLRLLDAVKNLRSTLDNIYYRGAEGEAEHYCATAATGIYAASGGRAS